MNEVESPLGQPSPVAAFHLSNRRRTIIAVIITAIIFGIAGYLLGSRNTQSILSSQPSLSRQQIPMTEPSAMIYPTTLPSPLQQPTSIPEPSPTITPIQCPLAPQEGKESQPLQWKTYTCPSLGVAFLYPKNLSVNQDVVVGQDNYVQIDYHMGYIFRISKYTSESQLLSTWTLPTDQTIFHGYPAYKLPEVLGQWAEQVYIVKVSPTAFYVIEYKIHDPRPEYKESDQEISLATTGIQKILDSIVFFID